eukprot:2037189-Rhodomonas_salina.1
MSNDKKFVKGDLVPTNLGISVANHRTFKGVSKGQLQLTVLDDEDTEHSISGEILYSPDLAHTLISVRQL